MFSASKVLIVWGISLILLVQKVLSQASCDMNSTHYFDTNTQQYRCQKCPDFCYACVDGGKNIGIRCSACHHGYHLSADGVCKKCATNCATCSGESLDRCQDAEPGFFYSIGTKQLLTCTDGCATCDPTGRCSRCKLGYLSRAVAGTENSTRPAFTCTKCDDRSCLFCDLNPFGKQICKHCAFGFGMHPSNGLCIPCQDGCAVCSSNSAICNYCKSGYFKNYSSGQCHKYQIENCINFDPESQRCLGCAYGFAVEPSVGRTCVSCSPLDVHCSRCGPNNALNTPSRKMQCLDCYRGYFLESSTKKCKACSEGCLYCNSDTVCVGCIPGYRIFEGKCVKKEFGCTDYLPNGQCTRCQSGYFLQKNNPVDISGVCKACSLNCLECDGEDQNHCTKCSINRLKTTMDAVKWGSIIFFQERHQCLETCPFGYQANHFNHECEKQKTDPEPVQPKQKYAFPRIDYSKDWKGLHADAYAFSQSFEKYQIANAEESDRWGKANPMQARTLAKNCHYRGILKERISLDRETVLRCECLRGYHGNNCEIDEELFKAAQNYIMAFSFDLLALVHGAPDDALLFKTYNALCTVPMSLDALTVIMFSFNEILGTSFKNKTREIGQYYLTMDSILMSHIQQRVEAWLSQEDKFDLNHDKVRREMAMFVDSAVENLIAVTKASPPNQRPEFGFQLGMRVIQESDTLGTKKLFSGESALSILHTENIFLTLGYEARPIELYISNTQMNSLENAPNSEGSHYINILGFSHVLFAHNHGLINDLIKIIVRKNSTWELLPRKSQDTRDKLKIIFPLTKDPLNPAFKDGLKCVKIMKTNTGNNPVMTLEEVAPESIDKQDNGYKMTCVFSTYNFEEEMYSVVSKSNKHDQHHEKVARVALEERDDYELQTYKLPSPSTSRVLTITIALLISVATAYFL